MNNPIIEREFVGLLRTRRALIVQLSLAAVFALIVLLRWPTDARVELSGAQARQVFHLFGYAMLATLILLVPVFPSTAIVREKNKGTLALLLNSPLGPAAIYFGKLLGLLGFVCLLLVLSFPAAVACYAMGGISLLEDIGSLYAMLALVSLQYATLGLWISSYAKSTDSALRVTYGVALAISVITVVPHLFFQGQEGNLADYAEMMRCVSPFPALMEVMGHSDLSSQGLITAGGVAARFTAIAIVSIFFFIIATISRLDHSIFDRPKDSGQVTDERGAGQRTVRRVVFLVDPQRRKQGIGPLTNPVMIKEFRTRRFGRSHWMLRLVAFCALTSLGLTYVTVTGTMAWGIDTIGGIMVILQSALIVLLTPSLAAGLISAERESGGWQLLQATPLTAGTIVRGKLMSVCWTVLLLLCATLPGYLVIVYIQPAMTHQILQVLACLLWTAAFAILLSASVSSLFDKTAPATTTSYAIIIGLCIGTLLFWLGRGNPFGRPTVEAALLLNPVAAALNVIEAPGFAEYELVPGNWWFMGCVSAICIAVLFARTWQLTRPR